MVEMMQLIIAPGSLTESVGVGHWTGGYHQYLQVVGVVTLKKNPPNFEKQRGGGQLEVRRVSIRSFQHEGVAASGPCPLEERFVDL